MRATKNGLIGVAIMFCMFFMTQRALAMNAQIESFGDGGCMRYAQVYKTVDGGTLIVGSVDTGVNTGGFVLRLDSADHILWKKRYGTSNRFSLFSGCEVANGNFFLSGSTPSGKGIIMEIDSVNGSVVSSREY